MMTSIWENNIDIWKKRYEEVYQLEISDSEHEFCDIFVFRLIGRDEYLALMMKELSEGETEEEICKQCVLYPKDYDFSKGRAGIATLLCQWIIYLSGFEKGQAESLLGEYRQELSFYDFQADCIIHEAFPQFTLEEIRSWSNRKTMYYLSRAEFILQQLRGIQIMPKEQISIQNEEQAQHFSNDSPSTEIPSFEEQMQQQNSLPKEGKIPQSEEELMAMLQENEAQKGNMVTKPIQNIDKEVYPELSWFKAQDDLKGEFD